MFNASRVQRVFFFNMAVISLIGLWLSGFDKVHWFTYVVPAGLLFASATGFCLGFVISKKLLDILGIPDKRPSDSQKSGATSGSSRASV